MAEITREEFKKIYDEKFVPMLEKLEPERVYTLKKVRKFAIIFGLVFFFIISACVLVYHNYVIFNLLGAFLKTILASVIVTCIICYCNASVIKAKIKRDILPKVLSIYGNLHYSQNSDVITLQDVKCCGLFPQSTEQTTDDVIVGVHKGLNFVISESTLQHTEDCGENRRTVKDFSGLVVKIQMEKKFTGSIVVGEKGFVAKVRGFEEVELESVDFMQHRYVFATDQIEARYVLTTAFIERLDRLALSFSGERAKAEAKTKGINYKHESIQKQPQMSLPNIGISVGGLSLSVGGGSKMVSASFKDGFVYLYIPSKENFFEIDINKSLLNFEQYYKIYNELEAILSVFDYLNLDSKTGL
jgi:hypothetical protein